MSNDILIILGALCMLVGFALSIRPIIPGVLISYIGMWILNFAIYIPKSILTFWGIAVLIILGIDFLSPKDNTKSSVGSIYLGIAALAGMFIGLAISPSLTIVGAFVGTIMGELAFARTPQGKQLLFPTSTLIHYFCAKGLRIIVTVSMIGIIINLAISK